MTDIVITEISPVRRAHNDRFDPGQLIDAIDQLRATLALAWINIPTDPDNGVRAKIKEALAEAAKFAFVTTPGPT